MVVCWGVTKCVINGNMKGGKPHFFFHERSLWFFRWYWVISDYILGMCAGEDWIKMLEEEKRHKKNIKIEVAKFESMEIDICRYFEFVVLWFQVV